MKNFFVITFALLSVTLLSATSAMAECWVTPDPATGEPTTVCAGNGGTNCGNFWDPSSGTYVYACR